MGSRSDGQPSPPLDAAKCLLAASPRPRMAGADSKWYLGTCVNSPSDRGHETNLGQAWPISEATRRPCSRAHHLSAPSRRPDVDDGSRPAHCACGCRVAPPEKGMHPQPSGHAPASNLFSWPPLGLSCQAATYVQETCRAPCARESGGRCMSCGLPPPSELGLAPDKRSEVCRAVPREAGMMLDFSALWGLAWRCLGSESGEAKEEWRDARTPPMI